MFLLQVGVEIKSLEVPVPKTDNPKDNNSTEVIKLREVGASLASRWHVHIPYASAIMVRCIIIGHLV